MTADCCCCSTAWGIRTISARLRGRRHFSGCCGSCCPTIRPRPCRVAEGALEFIELYRAAPFVPALRKLRQSHRVVGAAAEGGRPIAALPRSERPFALVLGNEEAGLRPAVVKACDELVTIPGSGAVLSLNVAASAAILIYTLAAQRD